MNHNFIDLYGQRFGKLVVIGFNGTDKNKKALWDCVCDCGKTATVMSNSLRSGHTASCGCLQKESASTHKLRSSPLYEVWKHFMDRCYNPKSHAYASYGGRGITVCDEWKSVSKFVKDMESTYVVGLTLDRIDVNGNYCKDNCRWTTCSVQCHNRRKWEGCSSQYIGVCFNKRLKKFVSSIRMNNIKENLGSFYDELEAAIAYDNRSEDLYGDRPNGTVRKSHSKEESTIV